LALAKVLFSNETKELVLAKLFDMNFFQEMSNELRALLKVFFQ
jgi:hypothetical protein